MFLFRAILAFKLVLVASVQSLPASEGCTYSLKETFHPPKDWVKQSLAPHDHNFILRISLAQPNFDLLEDHLYAVSDPTSPRYGQHLSKGHVQELSAPHPDALIAVDAWLSSHGFDIGTLVRSSSFDWVKVRTSVQKAEEMLNTTYHVWKNTVSGESIVRTTTWSVPETLKDHIDLVHPTTMFGVGMRPQGMPHRLSSKLPGIATVKSSTGGAVDPSCNNTITPTCLLQLYNAADYKIQAADKGNKVAITSYLEQFANLADLQTFFQNLVPDAVNSSFKVISVNGGQNNQSVAETGVEANLDVQYAFGLTFPTPATVFTTGGSPPFTPDNADPTNTNEPYLDWLDFVLDLEDLPQSISTSYADHEQTVPESFARTVCNGFARLGARGVSLMFGSGDGGVGDGDPDPATTVCQSNDGRNKTEFLPMFPTSCPFVTSVGGTVNVDFVVIYSELRGGGFSNYFSRPAYQENAVRPFLNSLGDTFEGLFNPNGRAYPDVAAQGDNFLFWFQGEPARTFNDITVGNNPGCGTMGFQCRVGWDPVTGLGTPNFRLLKDIVLK
ncbi:subtilisin-like protein [Ramaria rubella]|nr:subtilisin-like protein [Ramaria rubella]